MTSDVTQKYVLTVLKDQKKTAKTVRSWEITDKDSEQ